MIIWRIYRFTTREHKKLVCLSENFLFKIDDFFCSIDQIKCICICTGLLLDSPYGLNAAGSIAEQPEEEDKPVVIEIEEERINKPWNNWIKAVTVEAETDAESGKQKVLVQITLIRDWVNETKDKISHKRAPIGRFKLNIFLQRKRAGY